MGGKSDPPPAPDYTGAAQATAAGNMANARATTEANRVNTYTPYGSLTFKNGQSFDQTGYDKAMADYNARPQSSPGTPGYSKGGGSEGGYEMIPGSPGAAGASGAAPNRDDFMTGSPDQWSANISLDPQQQQLLEQQNKSAIGLGGLQDAAVGRVGQSLNSPYAPSYDPNQATNNAQQLIMSRLQPQFDRDQSALENKLANQGLQPGSEAWGSAMDQFGRTKNDAYSQAALQGINVGAQQQQQQYQQQMAQRNAPINELSAIRSGSQVTNPTFQNFASQPNVSGPDLLGAASSQYNAGLAASNAQNAASGNFLSGLMSMGGMALGGPMGGSIGGGLGRAFIGG